VPAVLDELAELGILGGIALERWYPELGHALLVCATETKTEHDVARYAQALDTVLTAVAAR
jgi:glycine cleavage system P protein (glycine dehydrogenase) subunit 1